MSGAKKRTEPFCKIEGCLVLWPGSKGYCSNHYIRLRKYGDPLASRPKGFQRGDKNPSCHPDARSRLSRFRKGVPLTPETRRKQSESLKRTIARPEIREKWRLAATGRKLTAETRRKISLAHAKRPKKLSCLVHKADQIFSRYIRTLYSDGRGNCSCFTCDAVKTIAETDCGHFVSRQHKSTRWMEKNAHPQCRYCNRYNEGRKDVYSVRLIQKYGPNILLELQEEKNKITHWTGAELEELIEVYKKKLADLDMCPGCTDGTCKTSGCIGA